MKNKKMPLFLRVFMTIVAFAALSLCSGCKTESKEDATRPKQAFQLGTTGWTYNRLTFTEALNECQKLGIKNYVGHRRQKLGGDFPQDALFHHTMSAETREKVLALAKSKGVTITSYGVITGKDEADWRQIFEFAKAMNLRDIATEPKFKDWPEVLPLVAKLSKESGIPVGIHNHEIPYSAAEFLEKIDAIVPDKSIGIYGDTGHWARSGFDPVEMLKGFEGRIVALHFKDLNRMLPKENQKLPKKEKLKAEDMPWGTGATNAAGQVAELRRQGFDGIVYIEYERPVPTAQKYAEVALCVEWFNRAANATTDELLRNAVVPPGCDATGQAADTSPKAPEAPFIP